MHADLLLVYELQQIDLQLQSVERKYAALDPGKAEAAADIAAKAEYEARLHEHKLVEADLLDAELEQKSVEQKITQVDRKLFSGKVTAPREMMDLQADLEALKRQRSGCDERVLVLMDKIEETRAAEAAARAKMEAAANALEAARTAHKQRTISLSKQAKVLVAKRAEAVKPIPEALLKRYETIRKTRTGIGIGQIEEGRCGGCHEQLSYQQIEAVKVNPSPQICDNCGRMLVIIKP